MPWFKVDDNLAFHGKTVAAGVAAMGLWVRAGAWSSQLLTDGFIPDHMVPALSDGQPDLASKLVSVGFWRKVSDGFVFHEWSERNPDSEAVKAKRRKETERKAAWRAAQAAKDSNVVTKPQQIDIDVVPAGVGAQNGTINGTTDLPDLQAGSATSGNGANGHHVVPAGQHRDNTVSPDETSSGVTGLSRATRPDPTRPINTSTSPTVVERSTTASAGADGDFDEFWSHYPKKVQKQDAIKAWKQMLRNKVTAKEMIGGAKGYAAYAQKHNIDREYLKHPASWLRAGGYADHQSPGETDVDSRPPIDILRAYWHAADAKAVAAIIRFPYVDKGQPPSDQTPHDQWLKKVRQEWINDHWKEAQEVLETRRRSA